MYSWKAMEAAGKASNGKRRKNSWTSEKETRLIGLYEKFRLLWDHRHPDYYKRDQRENAMRAIADGMGNEFDVVNVKDKIKTLRDYFVKEMKKEEGSRTSPCAYISRWEHYKCWEFLRGTVNVETSSQPPMPYPEVKREAPDVYPVFPSYNCENDMILPSTPDSSEEEGSGSPRKRPACHHNSTGSPLKHFALGSESTALTRDPVVSPFMNGFRTASLRPLPTKRLRQSTVPERTTPRQSNHVDSGSHSYETSSLSTTPSPSRVVGPSISAEAGNHTGPSASSSKVAHLPASDLTDGEALFCQQITSELREMAKYQRDLAKVRIQQVLFDVKYMSQAHAVGSSEELQRIQPTGVPTVPHLGQRAASIPAVNSSVYSTDSLLLSKGVRHPAFERAVSSV
ncbi:uncharacterized protein LOC119386195 [Rhipicephalus sanguineus]|uniref:uncharacterized protein LOC119386195 n=1 Tax=Rhipicephalus sanguineus TaxID=34632 RepID=UPI001893027E|nr:uncharacterized protein LOC119386195 [Rhipicephalus sanguineus]